MNIKTGKNNVVREKFIWACNFRASIHGWPTLQLWAQGEVEHYGGRTWQRKAAQDMATRKERKISVHQGTNICSKSISSDDLPPLATPYLHIVITQLIHISRSLH